MKYCHKEALCPSLEPHYLKHRRLVTLPIYLFSLSDLNLPFCSHINVAHYRRNKKLLQFQSVISLYVACWRLFLTPTITASETSPHCKAVPTLQRNVWHLSLPVPANHSSHHHPVLKITTTITVVRLFSENKNSVQLDVRRAVHRQDEPKHQGHRYSLQRRQTGHTVQRPGAQALKSELALVFYRT